MEYKSDSIHGELINQLSNQEDYFTEDVEEIPQVLIDSFIEILEALNISDAGESEDHTIKVINDFRSFLRYEGDDIENPQKKEALQRKKEAIIFQHHPIPFLIRHTSVIFSLRIRENSFSTISDLIVFFPDFRFQLLNSRFIYQLNQAFDSFIKSNDVNLLGAVYKGLGNFLASPQEGITRKVLENLNFDLFLISISMVIDNPPLQLLTYINFVLHNLLKILSGNPNLSQTLHELMLADSSKTQHDNFMSILAKTLEKEINQDTLLIHQYALDSIYLYLNSFPDALPDPVKDALNKLKINELISRFFENEICIKEQLFVARIIAQFYKFEIPDEKEIVFQLIPLLERVSQLSIEEKKKYIVQLCETLKEIFALENVGISILLKMFSQLLMPRLNAVLENAESYEEKMALYGLIAFCLKENCKYPPLNEFFFTDDFMIGLFTAADDDMNPCLPEIACALYSMFQICQEDPNQFAALMEYYTNEDGDETLKRLLNSPNEDVQKYAILIQAIIENMIEDK